MNKKYSIFPISSRILGVFAIGTIIFTGVLLFSGSVQAVTNCDDQAKPAFDCPTGYSMMCIPVGGDHWGCGKESNGIITESQASEQTSGVKDTMQTQVRTIQLKPGTESVTESPEKLLLADESIMQAKVNVRGWDAEKKQEIEGKIKAEAQLNKNITSTEITEDSVDLNYSAPAKILWLIPIKINLNINSDSNGRVKVKFPWYKFLLKTDFSNIAEEINGVFQNNQSNLEFLKLQDSAQRQTGLFQAISNILKAKHDISQQSTGVK